MKAMRPVAILPLSLLLGMTVLLVSCKKSSAIDDDPPSNVGVRVGNVAKNFSETDSNNQPIALESFRGKVILLEFSAMWCSPCRGEASQLMHLYNSYKARGFELLQCVYQDEDRNPADLNDLLRWIQEYKITFHVFNDPNYSTVNAYELSAIPLNIVIDKDLVIRYRSEGFDSAAIARVIEQLL